MGGGLWAVRIGDAYIAMENEAQALCCAMAGLSQGYLARVAEWPGTPEAHAADLAGEGEVARSVAFPAPGREVP